MFQNVIVLPSFKTLLFDDSWHATLVDIHVTINPSPLRGDVIEILFAKINTSVDFDVIFEDNAWWFS